MIMKLNGSGVSISDVFKASRVDAAFIELDAEARHRLSQSRNFLLEKVADSEVIYGVNTGFGPFATVRVSPSDLERLQVNILRSHSCGIGDPFSIEQTRAIMFLRANALTTGCSGIRPEVVDKILEFLNKNIVPVVPQQGSVGACGDLIPLAHLGLAFIGEGKCWQNGKPVSTISQLSQKNILPLQLQLREGLALINGCQVMTAVGCLSVYQGRNLLLLADLAAAMTLEALRGSRKAFDPLISSVRPHPGEAETASNMRTLLEDSSQVGDSHRDCKKVQDAYSVRCVPTVHGAAKYALRLGVQTLETEVNSSTDNPLIFWNEKKILSGGNFHGQPISLCLDHMSMAMTSLGSISERRLAQLLDPKSSGLPAHLMSQGGLNSGHMMVQVAAASLVSENKILSHPASVDSIPTDLDKEDHVSMGTIAARKFAKIVDHVESILALELLSASQALEFLRPLKASPALEAVYNLIRQRVPFANEDRIFGDDISEIQKLIRDGEILKTVTAQVGELKC